MFVGWLKTILCQRTPTSVLCGRAQAASDPRMKTNTNVVYIVVVILPPYTKKTEAKKKRKRTLNRLRARMGTEKKRQVWRVSATKRIVPPKKPDRSKDKLICRGGQSATSALRCSQPTLLTQRNPRPPSRHPHCCSVRNCSTTAFAFVVGTAADHFSYLIIFWRPPKSRQISQNQAVIIVVHASPCCLPTWGAAHYIHGFSRLGSLLAGRNVSE